MSQVGRKPTDIPIGAEVRVGGSVATVKGAKGVLTQQSHPNMTISQKGSELIMTRPDDEKENRALRGLTCTLIHNMMIGVIEGFKEELNVLGVGYRVQKQGKDLVISLGCSHQMIVSETDEIQIEAPMSNRIIIHGIGKQKVGQSTAEVREKCPPEPCKGKGIRCAGEFVRRKEDKAGKGSKK